MMLATSLPGTIVVLALKLVAGKVYILTTLVLQDHIHIRGECLGTIVNQVGGMLITVGPILQNVQHLLQV